jgi:hypothetical protein
MKKIMHRFNVGAFLGELVGPLTAGLLNEFYGF